MCLRISDSVVQCRPRTDPKLQDQQGESGIGWGLWEGLKVEGRRESEAVREGTGSLRAKDDPVGLSRIRIVPITGAHIFDL